MSYETFSSMTKIGLLGYVEVGGSNPPIAILFHVNVVPKYKFKNKFYICLSLMIFVNNYCQRGTIWYCASLESLFPFGYPGSNPGVGALFFLIFNQRVDKGRLPLCEEPGRWRFFSFNI